MSVIRLLYSQSLVRLVKPESGDMSVIALDSIFRYSRLVSLARTDRFDELLL